MKIARIPDWNAHTKNYRGFTIVELLIVIVVIALLAAIVVVAYNGIRKRTAESVLQADLSSAARQLGVEMALNGDQYPTTVDAANGGRGLVKSSGTTYQYTRGSDGKTYCLTATSPNGGADAYYISDTSGRPQSGVCSGHSAIANLSPNTGVVTTFAGSGVQGSTDGTGTNASFFGPIGIGIDTSDTLYISELNNNRIRKVTSSGAVSTLAGTGASGNADGTGTSASFNGPRQIAVDSSGTLYVADTVNQRIRKVTSSGVVTTFAGSTRGYADGTGTGAAFNYPHGIAIDSSGTLYVADSFNNRIRKVTSSGVVTTFAGSGAQGYADGTGTTAVLYSRQSIAIDSSGTLYFTDYGNHRIRKITSSGVVTTLAGSGAQGSADGTGTSATFYYPTGIAVDSSGTVYATDMNNRIRKITSSGVVTTLAGSGSQGNADGTGTSATFRSVDGIVIDSSGALFVTDPGNQRIRKVQ